MKFGSVDLSSSDPMPIDAQTDAGNVDAAGHGFSISGDPACCKYQTTGIFDCLQCIENSVAQIGNWPTDDQEAALIVLDYLENQKEVGMDLGELKVRKISLTIAVLRTFKDGVGWDKCYQG